MLSWFRSNLNVPVFQKILLCVAVLALAKSSHGSVLCGLGEYLLENKDRCLPCPPQTYMPKSSHRFIDCSPVTTVVDGSHMKVITPYTKTSDNVIICDSGYYKRRVNEDKSQFDCTNRCRNCSKLGKFEGRPCQGFDNTVCCDKQDMEVVDGKCKDKVSGEDSQSSTSSSSAGSSTSTSKYNHNCTCQPSPSSEGPASDVESPFIEKSEVLKEFQKTCERSADNDTTTIIILSVVIGILMTINIIGLFGMFLRERHWKKKLDFLRQRNPDTAAVSFLPGDGTVSSEDQF